MGSKPGLPPKRRMRHDRHMGEGIGRMIPTTSITSNHDQPRSNLGDLSSLVASIKAHGVLEPLLVRRRTDLPGYELVSGERRLHAALEAGLEEVPCVELNVDDQHALEIALIENLQRKDLDPFEEAEGFTTLIDKYSYSQAQVAAAAGRSRVTITESLRLLTIPPEVRDRCRHADIRAKGLLLELAKVGDPEEMLRLVDRIAAGDLDRQALRDLRRESQTSASEDARRASEGERVQSARRKPFVMRFRNPDRTFAVSLSFRTEEEPEPTQVIEALESLLADLRSQLDSDSTDSAE